MIHHPGVVSANTTDRERLLAHLVNRLAYPATRYSSGHAATVGPGDVYCDSDEKTFKLGDLAIGMCGAIGHLVRVGSGSNGWEIRLLGTDTVQRWDNEAFRVVRGIGEHEMLVGDAYEMQKRVRAIDGKGALYTARPWFERLDGKDAVITMRRRWTDVTWEIRVPNYKQYLKRKSLRKFLEAELRVQEVTPGHPYYNQRRVDEQALAAAATDAPTEPLTNEQTTT